MRGQEYGNRVEPVSRRSFIGMATVAASAAVMGGMAATGHASEAPASNAADAATQGGMLTPGTYEVEATGFNGQYTLAVTFDESGIVSIESVANRETPAVGEKALEVMAQRVAEHQSTNVDTVVGATFTSLSFKNAVVEAIEQAGGSPDDFAAEVHEEYAGPVAEDVETDVVIVGGGGAGMQTAIRLARRGVSVVVVEKRELMGGTSSRAGYQLMGVGSRTQKESEDVTYKTPDDYYDQYMAYDTAGVLDPDMLRRQADGMWEVMDWIEFDMGVPLNRVEPGGMALMLDAGMLGNGKTWGGVYVDRLWKEFDRLGIDYRTQTRGTELVVEDGRAVGVRVEAPNGSYTIRAKAVVIATGAFGSNPDMVAEYLPDWVGYPSNEVSEATGDGILMAQDAGAELGGMDENHLVVYTACVKLTETQTIPVMIRAAGGIVVNKEGRRFHDELDMQLINLALAAKEQTEGRYFGVVDQSFVDACGPVRNAVSADTIEELADKIGVDPEGLVDEVAHYNQMRAAGEDTDFHRLSMPFGIETPPFYGTELFTALHGFDGGIQVNGRMQALHEDGSVFEGLYAEGGGVNFGLATASAMSGKAFTAKILAETLLDDLGYNDGPISA